MCLSRSIQCVGINTCHTHTSAEYASNAFSSKGEYEKLAVVVHVLQTTKNLVIFHVVVLQETAKKCTKIYNARAQLLFRSLNLFFGDVLVAVAVVFCVRSLQFKPANLLLRGLQT